MTKTVWFRNAKDFENVKFVKEDIDKENGFFVVSFFFRENSINDLYNENRELHILERMWRKALNFTTN